MGSLATIGGKGGIDPFAAAAARDAGGGFATFMNFSGNDGSYTAGKDKDEIEHGTRLAVNVMEMAAGWICWKDGKVVDEKNVRVVDGEPPEEDELKDHGPYDDEDDGWRAQRVIPMALVEDGTQYQLKLSSAGGIRAFGALLEDFVTGRRKHGMDKVPVIELDATSFEVKNKKTGKKVGTKFAPKFVIVDWMTEDELIAMAEAGEDAGDYEKALPAPEKKARKPKAAEPVEEDEEEDEDYDRPAKKSRKPAPPPVEEDEDEDDDIPMNEDPAPPARGRRARRY